MSTETSIKSRILRALLYVLTAPTFIGWLFPILMMAIYAAKAPRMEPGLVLTAEWRSWVLKFWKYSTTISRGIIYQPHHRATPKNPRPRLMRHEHVHVRQAEDRTLLALVVALVVATVAPFPFAVGLWVSGIAWQLPNFLSAVLRGGHVYRDAEHERSAYAQTDERDIAGAEQPVSWLDQKRPGDSV